MSVYSLRVLFSCRSATSSSLKIWLSVSLPSIFSGTRPIMELQPSAADTLSSCSSEQEDR